MKQDIQLSVRRQTPCVSRVKGVSVQVVAILAHGGELPFEVVARSLDLPELQGMPEDIAREKCRAATALVQGPVMTEDTSLCFNAMGGLPGAFVKWFLSALKPQGLHKMLASFEDKSGYAQCIFAYAEGPDDEPRLFVGRTDGTIVEPRGPADFGWDPVFEPEGFTETYAEMSKEQKNSISHRYRALDKLREHLTGALSV